jgi:fucose permease
VITAAELKTDTLEKHPQPWKILSGLIVSGFLLALPGGLLPLWGYHIHPDFGTAGNYFLALGIGVASGSFVAQRLARRNSLQHLLASGCFIATLALMLLSFAAPPAQTWYQLSSLLVTGAAAGIVNTAVLAGMTASYESNPASVALLAGIAFGAGSVLSALLLSEAFGERGGTPPLTFAALIPVAAAIAFVRLRIPRRPVTEVPIQQAMRDLRSPLAIMFALLLFFQFGNEWSIAGWLPVFLIDRLGLSPNAGVSFLALYWLALMVGRIVASRLLSVVRHGKMLAFSAFCALSGCILLSAAGNKMGVVTGLLLTGAGFSAIYPLSAERLATRFSYYHPGYFNGIFTFALMGGILAPFGLGHIAVESGLRVVPLASLAGSCAVFALVLLIWLGRKVSGD